MPVNFPKNYATAANRLANHEKYGTILKEYNERFAVRGKVNDKLFWEEIIYPIIPQYTLSAWYAFLKRFKTTAGLQLAYTKYKLRPQTEEEKAQTGLLLDNQERNLTNQEATQRGIQAALNIGAARLRQLQQSPELMTPKEAADLLFKAMKAQDSRIHAIGKIREDSREQEKFDRAFDESALDE